MYLQLDRYNSYSGPLQLADCCWLVKFVAAWHYNDPKQIDHYNTKRH